MIYSLNGSSNDHRADALKREHQQRLTRFFVTFALVEGLALAAAVVVVYVLGLVDPQQGVWLIIGVAVVGGLVLSMSLLSMVRRHTRDVKDVTGR